MKLGILGGTFNPIHYGHLRAAEEVRSILSLDKVLFIPSGRPPFRKAGLIRAHHRYEMTKTAIKDNPFFGISDVEIESRTISYSVETIKKLAVQYTGADFFFIIGVDAFKDLPKWKQPKTLLRLSNLVVISRPGFPFANLYSSPYISKMKQSCRQIGTKDDENYPSPLPLPQGEGVRGRVKKESLRDMDKGVIKTLSFDLNTDKKAYLCRVSGLEISASQIRSLVKEGKTIKYLLPDSVESYIISNKLYCKSRKDEVGRTK